jgi:hypothetical protein
LLIYIEVRARTSVAIVASVHVPHSPSKHDGYARFVSRYARMNEHVLDLLSHDDVVPLYGAKMNGSATTFFKQLSQRTMSGPQC